MVSLRVSLVSLVRWPSLSPFPFRKRVLQVQALHPKKVSPGGLQLGLTVKVSNIIQYSSGPWVACFTGRAHPAPSTDAPQALESQGVVKES